MNQYNLRKDVDELQVLVAKLNSEVKRLRATTVNSNEYYTQTEVDSEVGKVDVKAEGLPYFFESMESNLIMDRPLICKYDFYLNGDCELVVSLPDGEDNPFRIDDKGNLIYTIDDGEDLEL